MLFCSSVTVAGRPGLADGALELEIDSALLAFTLMPASIMEVSRGLPCGFVGVGRALLACACGASAVLALAVA